MSDDFGRRLVLRGRRSTWSTSASFCVAGTPSRRPFQGKSCSYSKATLAATRHGHLFLTAFKLAVCRAPNLQTLPQTFLRQLSQLHTTAAVFNGVQACHLPGPKAFKL